MKIIVSGMGIIGASLAAALREAGHSVLGKNRSIEPLRYALSHGMIDGVAESYEGAEVVFLALPPEVTKRELDEGDFPVGAIVSDVCGVKEELERTVYSKERAYRYVGIHPMAGKEKSGVTVAEAALFKNKNLVVVRGEKTDPAALKTVRTLAEEIGFGRIVECTAKEHDEKIAFTSQLAHVVANAYIKSPTVRDIAGFTGGSFQDMARVGGVDERLWTELYLSNRAALLAETDGLILRLSQFSAALKAQDQEALLRLLKEGRLAHEAYFSEK